jgi:hypothetical protein
MGPFGKRGPRGTFNKEVGMNMDQAKAEDLVGYLENLVTLYARAKEEADKPQYGLIVNIRRQIIAQMTNKPTHGQLSVTSVKTDKARFELIRLIRNGGHPFLRAKEMVDNAMMVQGGCESNPLSVEIMTDNPIEVSQSLKEAGVSFMLKILDCDGNIKEVYSVL